jgi:4-hydroxyproline epimerase
VTHTRSNRVPQFQRIRIVDTHTGGEPTRVVVAGGPDLGPGSLEARREVFRERFDAFRSAVVNEPRGSDVLVGALLVPPDDPAASAGVIFFNNVGPLGMCGHGTIGVAVALAHLGTVGPGRHRLDTPVGPVRFTLLSENRVAVENVPAYRLAAGVPVGVEGAGTLSGDVAWGGNWFFLVAGHGLPLNTANLPELTDFAARVRKALVREGVTGADGAEIDHVELTGFPADPANHGRNFVLCPGLAYDRSPCGTGTSAKVACLAADGKLRPGEVWRQESVIGSVFEATYHEADGRVVPTITGEAFVTAEATLLLDPRDPFRDGIRSLGGIS